MTKRSMLNKNLCNIMFVVLVLTILVSVLPMVVKGYNENVKVKVEPSTLTVGAEPFNISITVSNVTKLVLWQIKLKFDPTILKCLGGFYPSNHVFHGMPNVEPPPVIDNTEGYVLIGCTVMGDYLKYNFNASGTERGTLCQIEFSAIKSGTTALEFLGAPQIDTFLWRAAIEIWEQPDDGYPIESFATEGGSVNADVPHRDPSEISISVSPTNVTVSQSITISGNITVYGVLSKPDVEVTILKDGGTLAKVKTDSNSHYEYIWKTVGTGNPLVNDVGTHTIKARWNGDATTLGNESTPVLVVIDDANATLYMGKPRFSFPSGTAYLINFTTGSLTFGDPTTMLKTPYNYTVYLFVSNITDLYAWQMKFSVSSATLASCTNSSIWVPQNGVFAGSKNISTNIETYGAGLRITIKANQTSPPPGYSVNGSEIGILCGINFTSTDIGYVSIHWFPEDTFLKNSSGTFVPNKFDYDDTLVSILGLSSKKPSEISLDVNPTTVKVGSNVTISGAINPSRPQIVNVTIIANNKVLARVPTDANSHYTYIWTTNSTGTYNIVATWLGDTEYQSAVSQPKTVTVQEEEPGEDYTPYIIAIVIVVIVIVGVILYFKKYKLPEESVPP